MSYDIQSVMVKLLETLAAARIEQGAAVQQASKMLEQFKASEPYVMATSEASAKTDRVAALEEELRGLALEQYETDQQKRPVWGGYEVKTFNVVKVIDHEQARQWCFDNMRPALKLDERALNDAATKGLIPNSIVSVTPTPKVMIKTDLTAFLPTDPDGDPNED